MLPRDIEAMSDADIGRHFSGGFGPDKRKAAIALLRDLAKKADAQAEKPKTMPFSAA